MQKTMFFIDFTVAYCPRFLRSIFKFLKLFSIASNLFLKNLLCANSQIFVISKLRANKNLYTFSNNDSDMRK